MRQARDRPHVRTARLRPIRVLHRRPIGTIGGQQARCGDRDLDPVAPPRLGGVQRPVGLAQQLLGLDGVIGKRGDPEARGQRPDLADLGPLDRTPQLLGDLEAPPLSVSGSSSRNSSPP